MTVLISSQIKTALLSHPLDVRFEHRQSERFVYGSSLALSFDSSGRLPYGARIESAYRCRHFYPSSP